MSTPQAKRGTFSTPATSTVSFSSMVSSILLDPTDLSSLILIDRLDPREDVNQFFDFPPKKCSLLYVFVSTGNKNGVEKLLMNMNRLKLNVNGVQEQGGGIPLRVAQQEGYVEIMALLLLFGATDEGQGKVPLKDQVNPALPADVTAQITQLWNTFNKSGSFGLGLEFLSAVTIYNKAYNRKFTGMEAIDKYIKRKEKLQYKERAPIAVDSVEESFYKSISVLLKHPNVKDDVENWIKEKRNEAIGLTETKNITDSMTVNVKNAFKCSYSPIVIVTQLYSLNVIILYIKSAQDEVKRKNFYVNSARRHNFPNIYLAYDQTTFQPLVDTGDEYPTTIKKIEEAIWDPTTTSDHFADLLTGYNLSTINAIINIGGVEKTILYEVCRSRRVELLLVMFAIENLELNGPQHADSGSSPLHVVSWNGCYECVLILLFKGANPDYLNKRGESALSFAPNLAPDVIEKMVEIVKFKANPAEIARMLDSTVIQKDKLETPTPIMTNLPVVINTGGNVSLDKLCELLSPEEPPSDSIFDSHWERFDKKNVNALSVTHKATPFYLACRSGSFYIVSKFMELPTLKLDGAQETRTGKGNTPLHVANWRGHFRVVAYLLTRVEPQPNNNGLIPGVAPEIFPSSGSEEDVRKANKLAFIITIANNRIGKLDRLRPFYEERKITTVVPPVSNTTQLALPSTEIPPQYMKLHYIWYEVKSSNNLVLVDLTTSSCLDTAYQKFLADPDFTKEVEVQIYSPPAKNAKVWPYTIWKCNFATLTFTTENGQKKAFKILTRAPTWYYQSQTGIWNPFPYKANQAIGVAKHQKRAAVPFTLTEGSFLFKKTTHCVVDFVTNKVAMTGAVNGEFPVKNEKEIDNIHRWALDFFDVKGGGLQRASYTDKARDNDYIDEVILVPNPKDPKDPKSQEYKRVSDAFYSTIPQFTVKKDGRRVEANRITKITKLYHTQNKSNFVRTTSTLREHIHKTDPLKNDLEYSKLLWHGTGSLPPKVIHTTVGSFKTNFASDKNLWGRGCYFASDASYSVNYAYQSPSGSKILLLVEVLVGQTLQTLENGNIVDVPPGYDSILGWRHGTWVYVTYDSARAFPAYAVEWIDLE